MMGLSNSVHWLAWFLTSFTQMSITMAVLTLMLKFGHVLMHSNALIIFITLELFAVATIAFSYVTLYSNHFSPHLTYTHCDENICRSVYVWA